MSEVEFRCRADRMMRCEYTLALTPAGLAQMKTLYVRNRDEWRTWLEKHATTCDEIFLIYYKKASRKPRIPYEDAVEEALCFGWIDGKVNKLDEERYAQRFTPRKPTSRWSALNIERAEKLIKAGRMTSAGLTVFRPEQEVAEKPTRLPATLEQEFKSHADAWKNFRGFPPFYQRMTIAWVASAKKPETQNKCLRELIAQSRQNKRIKFM
jgi:uncharacterized protein YdeI (YjbR/CyaY-like superfamily)